MSLKTHLEIQEVAQGDFEKGFHDFAALDSTLMPFPWGTGDWQALNLEHYNLFALTTKNDNRILQGFALLRALEGDENCHLLKVVLNEDQRGKGIAQWFFGEIEKTMALSGYQKVFLEVSTANLKAIAFYEKVGFKLLREIKGFYSNGESALEMMKTL